VHVADITDETACRLIASTADERMGGIDILYNSVGILGAGKAADVTEELWDRVMDVNLKAMWLVDKHVLPIMQRQRSGAIVHISSIAALRDGAQSGGATPYSISKVGVNRLTEAIASGYAEFDIRANAIMPGLVDTPMAIDAVLEERGLTRESFIAQRKATVPMAYQGTGWDIAYAALFLVSDESRYISGQCIAVDGARGTS
jgi:NAD(P)-dependent dehydrogenase (short-subunit alcohol dehydrogenase family)